MIRKYNYNIITHNYDTMKGKKIIIWCMSQTSLHYYKLLHSKGINVIGFTDSYINEQNEQRKTFAGLPVYCVRQLAGMEAAIFIGTNNNKYKREILEECEKIDSNIKIFAIGTIYGAECYDIKKVKDIISSPSISIMIDDIKKKLEESDDFSRRTFENLLEYRMSNDYKYIDSIHDKNDRQYFPQGNFFVPQKEEVFIDAGAHDGQTSWDYHLWSAGRYKKIYAFEPDKFMYEIVKEFFRLKRMEKAIAVNKGLYKNSGKMAFLEVPETGSSRISSCGEQMVEVVSIDDMFCDERIDFIKMDIEGGK